MPLADIFNANKERNVLGGKVTLRDLVEPFMNYANRASRLNEMMQTAYRERRVTPEIVNEALNWNPMGMGMAKITPMEKYVKSKLKNIYGQHKLIRNKDDIYGIMESGFQSSHANALPVYRGGPPINIMDKAYGPRKGDRILLIPKDQLEHIRGDKPLKVKSGYKPEEWQWVDIEHDYQSPLDVAREKLIKMYKDMITG